MKVNYNTKKTALLTRLYELLFANINPDGSYTNKQHFIVNRTLYTLGDLIHIEKSDDNNPYKRRLIHKSALNCKKKNSIGFESFISDIQKEIE